MPIRIAIPALKAVEADISLVALWTADSPSVESNDADVILTVRALLRVVGDPDLVLFVMYIHDFLSTEPADECDLSVCNDVNTFRTNSAGEVDLPFYDTALDIELQILPPDLMTTLKLGDSLLA